MKNKSSFLISLIILIIVSLAASQVVVSNKLSTSGAVLDSLRRQTSRFQEENEILKTELASVSSLTTISLKAREKGFIKDSSPLILVAGQTFALK